MSSVTNPAPARLSQAQTNTRHALTIAGALEAAGVRHVVISPGSRNTPLVFAFDALERAGKLKIHVVLDERVGGFVALGIARATGEPVALNCTSGSAGAHWAPAIAEAQRSALPLIAVTADRPDELQDRGAPQTMAQQRLFEPHVRETLLLSAPSPDSLHEVDTWQKVIRTASLSASTRLPVHINVGLREPLWDVSCDPILHNLSTSCGQMEKGLRIHRAGTTVAAEFVDDIRDSLTDSGAIYVGPIDAGQLSDQNALELTSRIDALGERLGWPVFGDAVSPVRAAECRTRAGADILFRDDELASPNDFRTLLIIGPWPTSKPLGLWLERHPEVRVISAPGPIGPIDPWFRVQMSVEGPITEFVEAIHSHLDAHSVQPSTLRARVNAELDRMDAALESFCSQHDAFEGSIARAVVHTVEGPATLHISSSMPIRDTDTYTRGPNANVRICSSRGVNGIDGNIATAFGAAYARQAASVLLIGDLAFRHDIGALAHAASHDEKFTIVVVDNNGGGIFRHLAVSAAEDRFQRYFLTPQGSQIADLVVGCGARLHRASGAADVAQLLRAVQHQPGTDVILVEVDGTQQVPWRKAAVQQATEAAKQR